MLLEADKLKLKEFGKELGNKFKGNNTLKVKIQQYLSNSYYYRKDFNKLFTEAAMGKEISIPQICNKLNNENLDKDVCTEIITTIIIEYNNENIKKKGLR